MPSTRSHSFVLLAQKLPANTLALKLLGRIVEDVKQPTNGYRPEDPRPLLADEPIETTDTDATIFLSALTDRAASAQLGHLFGLATASAATDTTKLEGKKIVTRILPQHHDAFEAVVAAHGPAVEKLLKRNGGVGYMVVGIKTISEGSVQVGRTQATGTQGHATLPVGAAVAAGTQGAVNLAQTLDPSAEGGRNAAARWMARNNIVGEQVFAIQYRKVVLEKEGRYWSGRKTAQLKAIYAEPRPTFDEPIERASRETFRGETFRRETIVVDSPHRLIGDGGKESAAPEEIVYEDDESEESQDEDDDLNGWAMKLDKMVSSTELGLLVLL